MSPSDLQELVRRAEAIYTDRLQTTLEPEHNDKFVAIEPESGDFFLGNTISEAASAARQSYPKRPTHAMRVGHSTALHIGLLEQ